MIYDTNTIYVTGMSKSNNMDPITKMYNSFFLGLILDKDTDIIIDVTCNTISDITNDFIKTILVGKNLVKDLNKIILEINERFLATSQKALIVALKDSFNKYEMYKRKNNK
ncbi:DUF3870 domain-containing protein [Clostridium cochlearium]|uniref:DUF3870 domain-containing protein n=1 Tax=Clostridium cochlearium TaxID=1494 RepID=A0A239YY97_CLOCO|nr:DUF3870 domain-containing protein [Clostridium cochlearium]MBU5269955.1 DUF3870 domain-containing protein [Clostridium cochlearium]MCR1972150.1 DUF3870 domain-containing protein [Clostridium cochlearium]MDU1443097.1 DUF3870 domain-containing protein [Clostridium cochlearium]NOH16596.1 DUF3870 domain-containing protein [Clostridium cochlearium]SDL26899.1 protein of unknown function [Clostridium cochlearium]